VFHLYTHAFFKALLFLGSGAVIHALAGEQDMRNMGGLRKGLPITFWTFLIGTIAIAGIPPLAGFFSKDEILGSAYESGHRVLWAIGVLTALLTATYMFRLVFLTFFGERRHDAPAAPAHPEEEEPAAHASAHAPSHAPAHAHANAHGLHDAPPAMAFALIVLAIGSIFAGFVGVPEALGGSNRIEHVLAPSFEAHATAMGEFGPAVTPQPEAAEAATHEGGAAERSNEWALMGVSVGAAAAGILIAFYFWYRNPSAADRMARRLSPVYTLLLNKYYVDELYDATIVHPIQNASTVGLWRGADVGLIDGAVNGVGALVRVTSSGLRRVQTGSIRTYAASLFAGVVLILGWYLLG
jgi:NADH-quinone oxidoreductase subunit L